MTTATAIETTKLGPDTIEVYPLEHSRGITWWVDIRDEDGRLVYSEPFRSADDARHAAQKIQNSLESDRHNLDTTSV